MGQGLIVDGDKECLGIADVGLALIRDIRNEALARVANNERPLIWTVGGRPEELNGFVASEVAKWGPVVKALNITP